MTKIQQILDYAQKHGATTSDAIYVHGVDLSVACRHGKQEEMERSESSGIGLRVWKGQRLATVSTSDLSDSSLDELAERAVAMASVATEDPHIMLASDELLVKEIPELGLADTYEPDATRLQDIAMSAEAAALEKEGITNSEGADCSYGKTQIALASSRGFYGEYTDTSFSLSASVLAGSGDGMERDYDYAVSRFFSDLPDAHIIGASAAEKTLKRLNPKKKESCQVPVVFDPRVARSLLGSFASAINGAAIVRGTSFLKDAMQTQLFDTSIQIMDDPHRARGLASHPFDAEGVACEKRAMVQDGVLQSWFLDTRSASKLGLTTTGHASRGLGSQPYPSSTNLYMEAGSISPDELMSDIGDGFYVNEAFGMGINLITGDYSQGASGFWIENGVITYPVSELTIAGQLKSMFSQLTPANDLVFRYGTNSPTLRVEGMTIAGGA